MGDSCSSRNRTLITSQSSMKWSPNEQYQSKAIPSRESGNCLRHNEELPAVGPHCRRNLLMCSRGSPKPLYWTNLGSSLRERTVVYLWRVYVHRSETAHLSLVKGQFQYLIGLPFEKVIVFDSFIFVFLPLSHVNMYCPGCVEGSIKREHVPA